MGAINKSSVKEANTASVVSVDVAEKSGVLEKIIAAGNFACFEASIVDCVVVCVKSNVGNCIATPSPGGSSGVDCTN